MTIDNNMIDIEGIKKVLPHRYPFLMIDRVIEFKTGEYIKAIKNISVNEPFFQGHFPSKSVMPGVLIIEAFAQAAALLGVQDIEQEKINEDSLFYLVGIDKARFRQPAGPGDQLIIEVRFITEKRNIWKYEASAYINNKRIASAELLTTVME